MKGYAYSFKDVGATLIGPGGTAILGDGAAPSDEGIDIQPVGDRNTMIIGADGSGMHNLLQDRSAHVTVTLLKNSPMNALLQGMLNYQSTSATLAGQNNLQVVHRASGDVITCEQVAFKKQPGIGYGKEGPTLVWEFDVIRMSVALGAGI